MNIDDRIRAASRELLSKTETSAYVPVQPRRTVRRGIRLTAVAVATALASWGIWTVVDSHGTAQINVAGVPTATDTAFSGTSVTSAVSWHGMVIAAGYVANRQCNKVGPGACPTVTALEPSRAAVWVSQRPFSSWKRTWQSPNPWVIDVFASGPPMVTTFQTLVPAGDTIFLFSTLFNPPRSNSWQTQMWSSVDATHWTPVDLPASLADTQLISAAYGHGKLAAISGYPSPVRAWVTTNGTTWTSSVRGLGRTWIGGGALAATSRGFLFGGRSSDPTDNPTVWSSADGLTWAATRLTGRQGYVERLATNGSTVVALVALDAPASAPIAATITGAFYISRNDRTWTMAKPKVPPGTPEPAGRDVVEPTADGYIAILQYQPTLWISAPNAMSWTGHPIAGLAGQGFVVDDAVVTSGNRVVVFGWTTSAFGDRPLIVKLPTRLDAMPAGQALPVTQASSNG